MPVRPRWLVFLVCLPTASCMDDDPFAPIESGDIRFTVPGITAADIASGTIDKSWSVAAEPGDPWGGFLAESRRVCGGDPENFEVTEAALGLDVTTGTVESLDEVFTGDAAVYVRPGSATANQILVGEGRVLGAGGEFVLQVPGGGLGRLDPLRLQLLAGTFHVAVRGATSRTSSETFTFDARVRLRAVAHCGESRAAP